MGKWGAILGAIALAVAGFGAGSKTIKGYKIETPPTIDGIVDLQKEWAGVPSGTDFRNQTTAQAAEVATTFWLAYDDKYIYLAAKMADPDPKTIKANAYQTNVSMLGDDEFIFQVDPFGHASEWCTFQVNPRGATKVSFPGGRAAKREWLGEFIAKGRITSEGWEVEARIPWAVMRLPAAGTRTLNVEFYRAYARTGRYSDWCAVLGDGPEVIGKWEAVEVPHIVTPRTLKLLPFGYLGGADGGTAIIDGGLDLKTALTDQIDLAAAFKPDFRNIERQILSLDFSHFERIASESRPFFMEGANFIDTSSQGDQFLSQRVPDFDAGAKAYGKIGEKTSFGVLDTNTFGESNAFVASASHKVNSGFGFLSSITSLDTPGAYNRTAGINVWHSWGSNFSRFRYIGSEDSAQGSGHLAAANLGYFKGSWQVYGSYQEITGSYRPALGLVEAVDVKGANLTVNYDNPIKRGPLQNVEVYGFGLAQDHMDGSPFQRTAQLFTTATWRNNFYLSLGAMGDRFEGVDEHIFSVEVGKDANDSCRCWSLSANLGSLAGADYFTPKLSFLYRPVQMLQLAFSHQYLDFNGTTDQTILTARYDLGRDNALSTRIVKLDNNWNAYFAYSRTGNRGIEYYVILGDPNAPSFRASLIFKVTVPFEVLP